MPRPRDAPGPATLEGDDVRTIPNRRDRDTEEKRGRYPAGRQFGPPNPDGADA
jgi:hypothetical protein